jgi:hypothetical protein
VAALTRLDDLEFDLKVFVTAVVNFMAFNALVMALADVPLPLVLLQRKLLESLMGTSRFE